MSGIGYLGLVEDQHSRSISFLEAENPVSKLSPQQCLMFPNFIFMLRVKPVSDSLIP